MSPSEAPTRLNRAYEPQPQPSNHANFPPTQMPPPREPQASGSRQGDAPSEKTQTSRFLLAGFIILLLLVCVGGGLFGRYAAQRGFASSPTIISFLPTFTPAAITATSPPVSNPPTATSAPVSNPPTATSNPPTATPPTTSSPIKITATPSSLPLEGIHRVGNGEDLMALASVSITVDGSLNEWEEEGVTISHVVFQPENWQNAQDLSGVVRAAYDQQFLYLAVRVIDDVIVQESRDRLLHRGDAVELFWDLALAEDFAQDSYSADDAQMVFSPGNFVNNRPSAWVHFSPTGNFRDQIRVASSRSREGYDIEIAIPWAAVNLTPRPGTFFGYAVALSDDDTPGVAEQQTQISTSPQLPFQHPAHWGNLILQ